MLKADAQKGRTPWSLGLAIALLCLVVLAALGLYKRSFGWGFVIGGPFVCGFVIGRWVRVKTVVQVLCGLIALGAVILGAVTANLAGAICGAVFASIAAIPLLLGVLVGSKLAGSSGPGTSVACFAFVAFLIPLEPGMIREAPVESVKTTRVVEMSAADLYPRITFYEDTQTSPPRLLRIALPRPIRTTGSSENVGDRPRCLYDVGFIEKEITAADPGRYYAFKVVRQVGVEDHAAQLRSGSFRLTEVAPGRTSVVLTTTYKPILSARLAWRPFEQAVIHALHNHVIDAMVSGRSWRGDHS